jgi:hypothetical protein
VYSPALAMREQLRKLWPPGEIPGKVARRAGMTRAFQSLVVPFGRELSPDRWIFVVGCYNSGTTLLHRIMGRHPRIGAMSQEGTLLTDALPKPEDFGWTRMWCECLEEMRRAQWPDAAAQAARVRRQWSVWYPRGSENLLEKSPSNVVRMAFLQEHFRPASFICIVRNGYAVAEGIRRRAVPKRPEHPGRYPLELCARQWLECDRVVSSQRSGIERFLQVYYEDLVSDPERVMTSITEFLELPAFDRQILESTFPVGRTESVIRDMNAASLRNLSDDDLDAIEAVAGESLRGHGYDRPARPDPAHRS